MFIYEKEYKQVVTPSFKKLIQDAFIVSNEGDVNSQEGYPVEKRLVGAVERETRLLR